MALFAKPVEGATHIHFFLGVHIKKRQVNRRTARMPASLIDVFLFKQHALV
jgi:hypothetical protein